MDPWTPLSTGALSHMVYSQPEHYSAVLQVRRIEKMLRPDNQQPYNPRRWQVTMQDDVYFSKVLAGGRMAREIAQGRLKQWTVIWVWHYETATPEGANWNLISIIDYEKLREPGYSEIGWNMKGLIVVNRPIGTGDLGAGHLRPGYNNQIHFMKLNLNHYDNMTLTWRTVKAAGVSDTPPDPPVPNPPHPPLPAPAMVSSMTGLPLALVASIVEDTPQSSLFVRIYRQFEPKSYYLPGGAYTTRAAAIVHDQTGEIEVVGFDPYDQDVQALEPDGVYLLSRFYVERAPEDYSRVAHPWRLKWTSVTTAVRVADIGALPRLYFNFVKIDAIERVAVNQLVDVLAVVARISDPMLGGKESDVKLKKKGKEEEDKGKKGHRKNPSSDRLDVWLVDDSRCIVRLCVFDEHIAEFVSLKGRVVAMKTLLVDSFGGVCLKTQRGWTRTITDDANPAHRRLLDWYNNLPRNQRDSWRTLTSSYSADGAPGPSYIPPTETTTIAHARKKEFGKTARQIFYIIGKIRLDQYRQDYIYRSCPFSECNKGVKGSRKEGGVYRCTCGNDYIAFGYRFHLNFRIFDASGDTWVHMFNGASQRLLGATAREMDEWRQAGGDSRAQYIAIMNERNNGRWKLSIEAKNSVGAFKGKINWELKHMERLE